MTVRWMDGDGVWGGKPITPSYGEDQRATQLAYERGMAFGLRAASRGRELSTRFSPTLAPWAEVDRLRAKNDELLQSGGVVDQLVIENDRLQGEVNRLGIALAKAEGRIRSQEGSNVIKVLRDISAAAHRGLEILGE